MLQLNFIPINSCLHTRFSSILLIILAVSHFFSGSAQTVNKKTDLGLIAGNVISPAGKAASFASVTLQLRNDTALIRRTIADKDGSFEFSSVKFGMYRIIIKAVGFANYSLDSINVRADRYDFNLGDIKLSYTSDSLEEVIVYAEKPLIENKDGRITYNVGESALSAGATTSELLRNMPLVSNDPNGKILLRGKEPKILIDDKPTDLTAEQLKDLLESLPGSSIEKIELMTNPPQQFATEAGGVINIVTKKGKVGLTGRVNINGGTRGEGNIGVNLSYRSKKFSFNGNIGIGGSSIGGDNYSRRSNFYTDSTNFFNTDGSFLNKNIRPNLRTQIDYEINKLKSINIVYQGNMNFFDNYSTTQFTNINKEQQPYRISTRSNGSDGTGYSHGLTFTYTLKGKKNIAEILRIIATGNLGKNENDRDFFQQFLNAGFVPYSDSTQNQFFDNFNKTWSLRVNYDKPLQWNKSMLSAGLLYQKGNFHNTLNTSFFRKSDSLYIPNDLLSNDFYFDQNIFTARVGISINFKKEWRLTTGIQAEHTEMQFEFIKGNTQNATNNYWNVLPNITLRKEFSKAFNSSLVYRASIRRPGIGELNPNVDYSDPYNLRFGNPYLQPQLADNFDWNFSFFKGKYYINTSLGYNRVKSVFNTIRTLVNGGTTQITWENIGSRNEYEVSIWGGYTFSKTFRINTSAGYTFNQYSDREKELYKYRDGGSFYTSFNYTFTPTNVLTFEGNARFSSFANPQGKSRSNLNMNIGVQRRFMNRRLAVSFNIIDPFRVQQFTTYTYGSNFTVESFNSTNTRNFRLAISYQLNKLVKSKLSEKDKQAALKKISKK